MITKLFRGHFVYYSTILAILILGYILVSFASPNRFLQLLAIIITAILYSLWGVLHHLLNHNLVFKIVVEYILISALGVSIAFFVLKGGFGI
jgi:hypothetical protein